MVKKYVKSIRYVNRQGKGKIDWTDGTFNFGSGCSNKCWYCYNKRFWEMKGIITPEFYPERLEARFDKLAPGTKIFVGSATDIFDPAYSDEQIQLIIDMMTKFPHIIFQILTKRPARYADFKFPKNCWLGTTMAYPTDQVKIDNLYSQNDNLRFISFEPLLGRIPHIKETLEDIDWVIIGRLTKHKEPYHQIEFSDWVYEIIEACDKFEIPIFIKNNVHKDTSEGLVYPHRQEFPKTTRAVQKLFGSKKAIDRTFKAIQDKTMEGCKIIADAEREARGNIKGQGISADNQG